MRNETLEHEWGEVGGAVGVTLVGSIVGILVLVATHIARAIDQVASAGNAFALAGGIEAFLVRARVLAGIRQPVHSGSSLASLGRRYATIRIYI